MKKVVILLLIWIACVSPVSCSGSGITVPQSMSETSIEMPYEMYRDNFVIVADSVDFFYEKSEFGYYICAVICLDFSDMGEEEFYWMEQDSSSYSPVIDFSADISSEQNELSSKSLSRVARVEYDSMMYGYGFVLTDEVRDYSDMIFELSISIEEKSSEFANYYPFTDIEIASSIQDISLMDETMYETIGEGLLNFANSYI